MDERLAQFLKSNHEVYRTKLIEVLKDYGLSPEASEQVSGILKEAMETGYREGNKDGRCEGREQAFQDPELIVSPALLGNSF